MLNKEELLFEGIIKIGSQEIELKRIAIERLEGLLSKFSEKDDDYSILVCDAIENEITERKKNGSELYLHPKEMVERWVRLHESNIEIGDKISCPVCEREFVQTHRNRVFCSNSIKRKALSVDCKGRFWGRVNADKKLPYTKPVFEKVANEED